MDIEKKFQEHKGRFDLLTEQVESKQEEIDTKQSHRDNLIKARWVVSEVGSLIQEQFKKRVESLVTLAIRSVFDYPWEFVLKFEQKRNKAECRIVLMDGEDEYDYEEDEGGGIIDVSAFALKVVMWSLESPQSRNIMIMDEPGKWTGCLSVLFGEVIKKISQELKIQIIMTTHDESLIEIGDRVWRVDKEGKEAVVTLTKGMVRKRRKKR